MVKRYKIRSPTSRNVHLLSPEKTMCWNESMNKIYELHAKDTHKTACCNNYTTVHFSSKMASFCERCLTTDEFPMWDEYLNPSLRYVIVLKDLLSTNAKYCSNNCLFAEGDHDRNEFILALFESWSSEKDTRQ